MKSIDLSLNSNPTRFDPWIGREYSSASRVRWLVLGESHYGKAGEETPDFTSGVIRSNVFNGRYRFFTMIAKLLLGRQPGTYLTDADLHSLWERIAFYNFVQCFVGDSARIRPRQEMWRAAQAPFLQVLDTLSPTHVLVLGWELWRYLPEGSGERVVDLTDGTRYAFREYAVGSEVCVTGCVKHPSGRGARYADDRRVVETLLSCTGDA